MAKVIVSAVLAIIGLIIFLKVKKETTTRLKQIQIISDNRREDRLFDEHLIIDATVNEYRSLSDVENDSDTIVIAEKTAEKAPTLVKNEQGSIQKAYTLSDFKVRKVVFGHHLQTKETFTLLENEAYDKNNGLKYHISGYEKMITGRNYLLLLHRAGTAPYFSITGINYGKVPLVKETSEVCISLHSANTDHAAEILDRYNHIDAIRKQARCKFAETISEYT